MAIEFKSRTFTYNQLGESELNSLRNDAQILEEAKDVILSEIMGFVKELLEAKTGEEEQIIYDRVSGSLNRQVAVSAHRFCYFFFRMFYNEDTKADTIEEVVADLGELGVGEDSVASRLVEVVRNESEWFKKFRLKDLFKKGILPYLNGVGTTIELRGVFNREISGSETAEKYSQEVELDSDVPVLPVISIFLEFDSGNPESVSFQASPESVEKLIERLKASLHKSKMLVDFAKGAKC